MTNISKFPDRRVVEEEAYDWLVKLDRDEPPTREDLEALREWLRRSPVHRQVLNSLNAFWSNNVLTELRVPIGRHGARTGFFAVFRRKLHGPRAYAVAAAAVMLAVALSLLFSADPLSKTNGLYLTAVGQQKTLHLADGSTVELNTNSQIQVEYDDHYRNVRLLQGEAYFQVARNTDVPFRVYAGAGRIQAIGTAFIVSLDNEAAVKVLVTQGRVALATLGTSGSADHVAASSAQTTERRRNKADVDPYISSPPHDLGIIEASQSITLGATEITDDAQKELVDSIEEIDADELARRQSWRNGLLVFAGEPLERVAQEVSRYTTVSIEIADPELREIQIGGRFRVGEIDEMFAALETNFGIQVHWVNYSRVELKAKRKKT